MTAVQKNKPWVKWYPADWRGDPRLRLCSLAARGLWADLLSYMHEGEPYGHLTVNGIQPDESGISSLVGRPANEVRKAIAELEAKQVYSRTETGVIFSRRMIRDKEREETDRRNGKGGGNPNLKRPVNAEVNPPDKAHMLEARNQKLEKKEERKQDGADAPDLANGGERSDPKAALYVRAQQVLKKSYSGGLITKLIAAKNGSIPKARATLELAAEAGDPKEYLCGALKNAENSGHDPDLYDPRF